MRIELDLMVTSCCHPTSSWQSKFCHILLYRAHPAIWQLTMQHISLRVFMSTLSSNLLQLQSTPISNMITNQSAHTNKVNSLTAKPVPAGTKNSRPVGFYSRNSTKSTVNPNTTIPQIWPPWWCRLPLIRRGIYGSSRLDARNLFRRCRAGGWSKRII
jgi:hypothetical protein